MVAESGPWRNSFRVCRLSYLDIVHRHHRSDVSVTPSIERARERKVRHHRDRATAQYFYRTGQRFVNTRSFDGCLDLRTGAHVRESFINHENEIGRIHLSDVYSVYQCCNAVLPRRQSLNSVIFYSFTLCVTKNLCDMLLINILYNDCQWT